MSTVKLTNVSNPAAFAVEWTAEESGEPIPTCQPARFRNALVWAVARRRAALGNHPSRRPVEVRHGPTTEEFPHILCYREYLRQRVGRSRDRE
jgi:hypothetical protein